MPQLSDVLVPLILKNLSADDKAALEAAIVEKLSDETAAALKRRDEAQAEAEKKQRWLDDVRREADRLRGQLQKQGLL